MKWTKPQQYVFNQGGSIFEIDSPLLMGIINVTPDSFYSGSRYSHESDIIHRVEEMIQEGADIIDLGAMSSRPGADIISAEEEWGRLGSIISHIKSRWPKICISIDTIHSEIASKSLIAGADWINDISGGEYDSDMVSVVANHGAPYVCMHMRGTPKTMKSLSNYEDVVSSVYTYFSQRIRFLRDQGIKDIVIDPGFGFAKNIDQNFQLLNALNLFHSLDCPILVGLSRKSMIYKTLNIKPEQALNGTTALHTTALLQGAHILRVHDVREAREVKILTQKLRSARFMPESKD